jgi:hypothetical protein
MQFISTNPHYILGHKYIQYKAWMNFCNYMKANPKRSKTREARLLELMNALSALSN